MFHYVLSPRVDDVPMQPPMKKTPFFQGIYHPHEKTRMPLGSPRPICRRRCRWCRCRQTHPTADSQLQWGSVFPTPTQMGIQHLPFTIFGGNSMLFTSINLVILGFTPGFFDPSPFVSRDNSFKISTRSNKIRRHQRQHQHMVHINPTSTCLSCLEMCIYN